MSVTHAHTDLTADLARRWDEFVSGHPQASLYHSSRWITFAAEVFGFDAAWLTCESASGVLAGVLPMIRQQSRLFGDRWVSLPYFNYGGPLVVDTAVSGPLIERAADHARATRVRMLEIRDIAPREGIASRTDKVTLILELPDTAEALGERLGAKLRSQIRRSDREAPEIAQGGADLVAEFYAVFSETMRDLGTPVLPLRFFERMFERVGDDCRIVIVRLAGRTQRRC
jgi:hypothetical protein